MKSLLCSMTRISDSAYYMITRSTFLNDSSVKYSPEKCRDTIEVMEPIHIPHAEMLCRILTSSAGVLLPILRRGSAHQPKAKECLGASAWQKHIRSEVSNEIFALFKSFLASPSL